MKKLLVLTAVLMLTGSAVGCRCCNWLWRGAAYNPALQPAAYGNACPTYDSCDPCGGNPSMIVPGPAAYESPVP